MRVVAGLFETMQEAHETLRELRAAGLDPGPAAIIARDPHAAYDATPEDGREVPVGTAGGVGIGGVVGGVVTWLMDTAELISLEISDILELGPLEALVDQVDPLLAIGIAVGALAGGLLGGHAAWSYVEGDARTYRERVARGDVLITIEVPDSASARLARGILRRRGGRHVRQGLARC